MCTRIPPSAVGRPLFTLLVLACGGTTGPEDNNRVDDIPRTGTLELSVSTTGHDVDSDGYVLKIDGEPERTIPANGRVTVAELEPGERSLAVTDVAFNCESEESVSTFQITAGDTTHLDLGLNCIPYLSNAIVYVSEQAELPQVMVTRPDGSRRERITTNGAYSHAAPAIAPDGRRIALSVWRDDAWAGIHVMNATGSGLAQLVRRSDFDGSPAWSPDGTRIAFRSENSGPHGNYGRIFVINTDGSGLRQLTPDTPDYTYDDSPSWAPDGGRVVFSRSGDLYTIKADGTGLSLLMTCRLACEDPVWSPGGEHIGFAMPTDSDNDGVAESHLDVYVMNVDGSNVRQLTTAEVQEDGPSWSLDGKKIVFQRWESDHAQLYIIGADGTGESKLSTQAVDDYSPHWSPVP